MRILSGVKPSGDQLHIGNYLGALKHWVHGQTHENENFFMIANLHAITTVKDGATLRTYTFNMAKQYLAVGLDPEKSVIFAQSEVPFHTELTWILNCLCPMGLLERAHAFKDAQAKNKEVNVGLFNYPVLQTTDIILYQADQVPVGKDQKQHIEIARDLAIKFNNTYGETFILPEPIVSESTQTIIGTDGQKMSKSYGNTIGLFEDEKSLHKKVMSIVTDSKGVEEIKDPDTCSVFQLLKHFAPQDVLTDVQKKYRNGGIGYGDTKKILLESILYEFKDIRERYASLESNADYVMQVVKEGSEKAYEVAQKTMSEVREKVGY